MITSKIGALGLRPLARGRGRPARNTPLLYMYYRAEIGRWGQTVRALFRRSSWKMQPSASRLSRSHKVIGIDTKRSM